MCYDIVQLVNRFKKKGIKAGDTPDEIEKAVLELKVSIGKPEAFPSKLTAPDKISSGFDHHFHYCIYRNGKLLVSELMKWGLVPPFAKESEQIEAIINKTLNARSETIFERASFKQAILNYRCLLPVNGFFEHHHKNGKKFPFFIFDKSQECLFIAAIYSISFNHNSSFTEKSFSVVTTIGNELMQKIHNNPMKIGSRMPLILDGDDLLLWLNPAATKNQLVQLMKPCDSKKIDAYSVRPIKGKKTAPSIDEALTPFHYQELNEQQTLF